MSLPKLFLATVVLLICLVGGAAAIKRCSHARPLVQANDSSYAVVSDLSAPFELSIEPESQPLEPAPLVSLPQQTVSSSALPEADRVADLFDTSRIKLPIVETITYRSRVPWQKGRAAWLSDYAAHYETSRHFIARSLNGKPDYLKQEIAEGDKFNVLRKDKDFKFYLLVDTSRCKMWFYYIDHEQNKKTLLKTYPVGLGRLDSSKPSGLLTPLGTYSLGDKTATYQPKVMGTHKGKNVEMITIFGTRWIPFEKEIGNCTAPARGFGIHGTPWERGQDGVCRDNTDSLGKFESDGCIRLSTRDLEEIYAIIVTKPTEIEIVPDYAASALMAIQEEKEL